MASPITARQLLGSRLFPGLRVPSYFRGISRESDMLREDARKTVYNDLRRRSQRTDRHGIDIFLTV